MWSAWSCLYLRRRNDGRKALDGSMWTTHGHEIWAQIQELFCFVLNSLTAQPHSCFWLFCILLLLWAQKQCLWLPFIVFLQASLLPQLPPPGPSHPFLILLSQETKTPASKLLNAFFVAQEEQLNDLIPTYAVIGRGRGRNFNSWEHSK